MFKSKTKKAPSKTPRIAVFIDAGNLWGVYKVIGKMLDLNKLNSFFATKFNGNIFRIFYYVAYPPEGTRPKENIKKHHNFFDIS